jgi:hypothetical protein
MKNIVGTITFNYYFNQVNRVRLSTGVISASSSNKEVSMSLIVVTIPKLLVEVSIHVNNGTIK